jgi:hypothetical protein
MGTMTDPIAVQRAREWLEQQLAELGQLRNASRRDQHFKAWRQHTLTVIQRIWPGDSRRTDRFRRIPFSPPMARASDRQVRLSYERGWGEAGVLLRELLAEVNLLGLSPIEAPEARGQADPAAATEPAALPSPTPEALPEEAVTPEPEDTRPSSQAGPGCEDIRRAMERLLGGSPLIRGGMAQPEAPSAAAPGTPAAELVSLADDLESHGLDAEQARLARKALLGLAGALEAGAPDWDLVRGALQHAVVTPALARRALPLLLGLIEKAA